MSRNKEEINKLKEGCGKYTIIKGVGATNCGMKFSVSGILCLCLPCQAKLQTWKQALTNQLKELDEDIEFFTKVINEYILTDLQGRPLPQCKILWEIKSKLLAQKQAEKIEVSKLIGEIK